MKVTRLAFGTGSFSGQVQRELGQEGFTRLVRYAYDHGIRFFETAESYGEMHRMLGIALKGIPRESYQLMSKVTTFHDGVDPQEKFDELRKLANTDYFDIMLLHWQHAATWPADTRTLAGRDSGGRIEEGHREPRRVGSWPPRAAPGPGKQMARRRHDPRESHKARAWTPRTMPRRVLGNVPEVVEHVKEVRKQGMGVISMKLIGEGTFNREDRQKAMRFAFRNAGVDCVTVGYKSTAEIDEAIANVNAAFA